MSEAHHTIKRDKLICTREQRSDLEALMQACWASCGGAVRADTLLWGHIWHGRLARSLQAGQGLHLPRSTTTRGLHGVATTVHTRTDAIRSRA
jgi:hypothetical protein